MDMTWLDILLFIGAILIMLVGLIGAVVPVIPGALLIFITTLVYAVITDFQEITKDTLIVLLIITAVTYLLEWLSTTFGVKRMGGSLWGVLGAFVGMIVGLVIPGAGLIGFIVGAFAGAVIFELIIGKTTNEAFKAGLGSFIGFLAGGIIKLILCSVMIGIFVWNVLVK